MPDFDPFNPSSYESDPSNSNFSPAGPLTPDAITALVEARGNLHLAAEVTGLSHAELVRAASTDLPRLQLEYKARALLDSFYMLDLVAMQFRLKLSDLEPADISKTYTTMMQLVTTLTDDKTRNVNINVQEIVWQYLGQFPGAREAILELQEESDAATPFPTSDQSQPDSRPFIEHDGSDSD